MFGPNTDPANTPAHVGEDDMKYGIDQAGREASESARKILHGQRPRRAPHFPSAENATRSSSPVPYAPTTTIRLRIRRAGWSTNRRHRQDRQVRDAPNRYAAPPHAFESSVKQHHKQQREQVRTRQPMDRTKPPPRPW